jgi:hypothetical protein
VPDALGEVERVHEALAVGFDVKRVQPAAVARPDGAQRSACHLLAGLREARRLERPRLEIQVLEVVTVSPPVDEEEPPAVGRERLDLKGPS